jgi:hypothetical protein
MNLGPPSTGGLTRRPFQSGQARGYLRGAPNSVTVEWLVDTGADIATVWDSVGSQFDRTRSIGFSAKPTTGGGGIQVVDGIEVEFSVEDAAGNPTTLVVGGMVAVKSNDATNNLLGMEQLAAAGASVEWDPSGRAGTLRI